MNKIITFAAALAVAGTGRAYAGGQANSLGIGAEFGLDGETGGASVNYDAGLYHVGGFLGFKDGFDGNEDNSNDTSYTIGGRFYWHLHKTAMSDFGIGGGLGLFSAPGVNGTPPGSGDRVYRFYVEPGFQIRLFVASNVALSFSAGFTLGFVDTEGVSFGAPSIGTAAGFGAVNGSAGIHYYFF